MFTFAALNEKEGLGLVSTASSQERAF